MDDYAARVAKVEKSGHVGKQRIKVGAAVISSAQDQFAWPKHFLGA
ncbi:MAG: hypothetical protein AAF683_08055 [Pseudomonadota bacterium]